MNNDQMRSIEAVEALSDSQLSLHWSDGTQVSIEIAKSWQIAGTPKIGDWGHSLEWPNGTEMSADRLWLETLSALGRDDSRQFLEWRMHHGLSLGKAAEALGLARRTIAYYSNGGRPVPRAILLACKGWEAEELQKAA